MFFDFSRVSFYLLVLAIVDGGSDPLRRPQRRQPELWVRSRYSKPGNGRQRSYISAVTVTCHTGSKTAFPNTHSSGCLRYGLHDVAIYDGYCPVTN